MIINGYDLIEYTGQPIYNLVSSRLETYGTKKRFVNLGCGFDCETTKTPDDRAFPYVWQMSIGKTVLYSHHNELILDLLTDLDNIISSQYKGAKIIVWVANLGYEYSFYKSIWNDCITKIFARDKRHPLVIDMFESIQIRECLGVFGYSLANIADNYTTTKKAKGDLDYTIIRVGGSTPTPLTETELGYIVNDVAILSELTQVALDMFTDDSGKTTLPCTQTGILRNEVRNNLTYLEQTSLKNDNYKWYTADRKLYTELRNFLYSGGLTHSLHTAVTEGLHHDITCYDLTSAYPWAFQRMFPTGRMCKTKDIEKALSAPHYILKIIIQNLVSKTEHSIISQHKALSMINEVLDNGRVYSAQFIEIYVNEIDLANIKKIYSYSGISVQEIYYFNKSYKCPDFAKSVMLNYYLKKQVLKEQGLNDTLEYLISKQKVNSVYGMFVTQVYSDNMEYNKETKTLEKKPAEWDKSAKVLFNPFIGYWCTSYVRSRLVEVISQFPEDVIQYDTDSVYCKNNPELHAFISTINSRISEENLTLINDHYAKCRDLGLWDNDGFYEEFKPMGAKRYIGKYPQSTVEKKLNKKYYSKGKTPTLFEIWSTQYKITFAGAKDSDILRAVWNEITDKHNPHYNNSHYIYEYIESFDISSYESTKLCAKYFDDTLDTTISDSYGNTQHVIQEGGTCLLNATFKAVLSEEYSTVNARYESIMEHYNKFGDSHKYITTI